MSYLGPSYMICTILLVAYISLFGKYSRRMMKASVAGLPLLTTLKYFLSSTTPTTLSLGHVFIHFYLMKAEGCSIRSIAKALYPWLGWKSMVCGIVFCQFSTFTIMRSMERPTPDYHNSLVFMNETKQKNPQVPLLMKNMM